MRQNVVIALGLKAVFLVTTVLGLVGLWIAVLADTGATVLVTLSAMRLRARYPGKWDSDVRKRQKPLPAALNLIQGCWLMKQAAR